MASFSKWNAKQDPRTELHDVLGLTGAEISAAADSAVSYACIQVRENSLEEYTAGDAVIG